MKRSLLGTAFILALATAATSAPAAVTFQPLGGPYYPENAPSPPSIIFEPAPSLATMYSYPYGYSYAPYRRGH